MRKVLFAGISAVALTLAFGSVASADEHGNSGSNFQLGQQNNNKAGGNVNDSSTGSGQQGSDNSMENSNNVIDVLAFIKISRTSVKADQDIRQENSHLGVKAIAKGGDGGNGGNANGGNANGGNASVKKAGVEEAGVRGGSAHGDAGEGGEGGDGGGGGGGSVATGNVTTGGNLFNAGVFNNAVSTGFVNNTNASTNIAANANNTFGVK